MPQQTTVKCLLDSSADVWNQQLNNSFFLLNCYVLVNRQIVDLIQNVQKISYIGSILKGIIYTFQFRVYFYFFFSLTSVAPLLALIPITQLPNQYKGCTEKKSWRNEEKVLNLWEEFLRRKKTTLFSFSKLSYDLPYIFSFRKKQSWFKIVSHQQHHHYEHHQNVIITFWFESHKISTFY